MTDTKLLIKRAAEAFMNQLILVDNVDPEKAKTCYKKARAFAVKRQEKMASLREGLKKAYASPAKA